MAGTIARHFHYTAIRVHLCPSVVKISPGMDSKTLSVLEYPKVLARLGAHCDFSASKELALALEPTASYDLALMHLQETSEARHLLSVHDLSIGGAHDIRPQAELAARGGVLEPQQLMDVKSTLIACRELRDIRETRFPSRGQGRRPEKSGESGCHRG